MRAIKKKGGYTLMFCGILGIVLFTFIGIAFSIPVVVGSVFMLLSFILFLYGLGKAEFGKE